MRHGPRLDDLITDTATARRLHPVSVVAGFRPDHSHDPPAGMSCPGDRLVRVNTPTGVYHFKGQRYFGCTKTGKFLCQHDANLEGDRSTRNGQ